MYKNIGGKIKILAQTVAIIEIIVCIIVGFIQIFDVKEVGLGIGILIIGSLIAWISSFVLYGFGQLVENSDKVVNIQEKMYNKDNFNKEKTEEYLEKIAESVNVKDDNIKTNTKIKLSNVELLKKAEEQLNNFSDYEIKEIKRTFKDWYKEIKKLSMQELIDRLNNVVDWQSPYIVLCCLEIKDRI